MDTIITSHWVTFVQYVWDWRCSRFGIFFRFYDIWKYLISILGLGWKSKHGICTRGVDPVGNYIGRGGGRGAERASVPCLHPSPQLPPPCLGPASIPSQQYSLHPTSSCLSGHLGITAHARPHRFSYDLGPTAVAPRSLPGSRQEESSR